MISEKINSHEAYSAQFPSEIQSRLDTISNLIQNLIPEALPVISYAMPAYKWNGNLVYFAGYKNHIGFYPTGSGIKAFQDQLSNYRTGKGSIQFPNYEPLPIELITAIVQFRIQENLEKTASKIKKRKLE